MSAGLRGAAGALTAAAALLAAAVAPLSLLAGPARAQADAFDVTGAQLRWGVNNESNNRAFAPGTHNFFSAGIVPDPGRGGTMLPQGSWRAEDGNVRIEKQQADHTWATATWAGLRTTPDGTAIPSPTSGQFSNHQVVLSNGTGSVDPAAGTATVTWRGSFTVLYYSGMSYFTVTDPVLTVTADTAQLTATAGGFASSMEDQSQWSPLPPTTVVLADLSRAEVDLSAADGFASTPAYLGVAWTPPAGGSAQAGGQWKGAFPASLLGFLSSAGSAGYWYSTGGATDAYKVPLPLTVSWAGAPIATPAPSSAATPTKTPTRSPSSTPTRTPTTTSTPTSPTGTPSPSASPTATPTTRSTESTTSTSTSTSYDTGATGPTSGPRARTTALPVAVQPVQPVQPVLASATTSPPAAAAPAATDTETHTLWLLGCVLLLGALATTLISVSLVSTTPEGKK